jgi:predicted NBD/HSP70 family sugar kinase
MAPRPAVPTLLRELNDRAALRLLLDEGPVTRTRIAEHTGLSKVTASQMIERLVQRGFVSAQGIADSARGPHATTYGLVRDLAYVVGVDVNPDRIVAVTADITGETYGRVSVPNEGVPAEATAAAVRATLAEAGVQAAQRVVIGLPGLVDPRSGELQLSWDLPGWGPGLVAALQDRLGCPVVFENDANVAAVAEGLDDFVLVWLGRGIGLATVLAGRLLRGTTGAAGELGFLPVPGAPLPVTAVPADGAIGGSFQHLVGADSVVRLASEHGFAAETAEKAVAAAAIAGPAGLAVIDELARRIALGVTGVSLILDPTLIVLSGEVGRAGGALLARRVEAQVARISLVTPRVAATGVPADPVLRGAVRLALRSAQADVLGLSS